jgi:subtilisin family serine protease
VGVYNSPFQPDIDALQAAGIMVVFSAGNDGPSPGTSVSPGNNRGAFPVGAVDSSGTIAFFSSRGPSAWDGSTYPALVAPGVHVRSSYVGGSYATFSGTSFSAPHVAGAMTLLKSALPGLTVADAETALQQSVVGTGGPDNTYGWGRLDVGKAYAYLAAPGDVNGDGRIDVVDVLISLSAVVNPGQQTPLIVKNADVNPLGADLKPRGNGVLDIADALLLLRRAMGIVTW